MSNASVAQFYPPTREESQGVVEGTPVLITRRGPSVSFYPAEGEFRAQGPYAWNGRYVAPILGMGEEGRRIMPDFPLPEGARFARWQEAHYVVTTMPRPGGPGQPGVPGRNLSGYGSGATEAKALASAKRTLQREALEEALLPQLQGYMGKPERALSPFLTSPAEVQPGDRIIAYSRGATRRAIVTHIAKTGSVTFAYVTRTSPRAVTLKTSPWHQIQREEGA